MRDHSDNFRDTLLASFTLTLWLLCAAAGAIGLVASYPRPAPPAPELHTQLVEAELPNEADPAPPPQPAAPAPSEPVAAAPEASPAIPGAPPAPAWTAAPTVTPVAAPSAAVAFAVPVEGLTRIVDVAQAAHGAPAHPAASGAGAGTGGTIAPAPPPPPRTIAPPVAAPPVAPPVAHLTFGQGEGRQPPPQYPRDAIQAGQEGTVVLRFQVDETGRVTSVNVASAARWPLLNQAAVRAVRETWHFAPGPVRLFEVPIEFQLSRN